MRGLSGEQQLWPGFCAVLYFILGEALVVMFSFSVTRHTPLCQAHFLEYDRRQKERCLEHAPPFGI